MNWQNLHTLIDRYEENYYMVNNEEHDEKFKWEAVQRFQNIWFQGEKTGERFSELFDRATKDSGILINNSMMSPTKGIVKMAERRPEEVEHLFRDVLLAECQTIDELQLHMDCFINEMEKIRNELFPRFYRYKQDRHSVSCYLAMYAPEQHYIYRYSSVEAFAQNIEFGKDLGSGADFRLSNYYEMADIVVKALQEHKSLLEKYEKVILQDSDCYHDESLHLMAFDLMYCCTCYDFYAGMIHLSKKESVKAYTIQEQKEKEEAVKVEAAAELEKEIRQLTGKIEKINEISLLNVEVTQKQHGLGVVVAQNGENITVQFDDGRVKYIINKKYTMRPRFEDDERVVEAFTQLTLLKEKKIKLEKQLTVLIESK